MSTFRVLEAYSMLRREVSLISAAKLKALDFGHKQMMILFRLTQSPAGMTELADFSQSDKASISRAVDSLEAAGWVKRTVPGEDRRKSVIELTSKGKLKAAKADEIRQHIGEQINQTLNAQEQKELSRLLNKVSSGLQEMRKTKGDL
jgi:DNA-binding MarR family transcriptional regulator